MKNLLKPYWIFIAVSLPLLIMFWLYLANYQIIKSLLSSTNVWYWKSYGALFGLAWLGATGYGIWATVKKAKINAYYGFISLAFFVTVLYFFMQDQGRLFPGNIPRWMLSINDLPTYTNTFLMPAIFHSLCILVLFFTPNEKERNSWWNFAVVLVIPLTWYIIFTVILPAVNHGVNAQWLQHVTFLFFASSTVVFFFFLLRGSYIISSKKSGFWQNSRRLLWQVPFFLIFPIVGLALNNADFDYIFGNFSAPEFYILAVVNGILILISDNLIKDARVRLFIFVARSITFSYILYFFLVFLPLLPFSILAIIVVGAGFLMLTPLLITIYQANLLWRGFRQLSEHYSPYLLTWLLIMGLAVLPITVAYNYKQDRRHLNKALELVYAPNLNQQSSKPQDIDPARIKRVLDNVRENKDMRQNTGWFDLNNKKKPYLSAYYQWAVLDNLTLSQQKLDEIERIFLDKSTKSRFAGRNFRVEPLRSKEVKIDTFQVKSTFVQEGQYWRTWVHLDIQNPTDWQQEYATQFKLPAGTWISNYYLMIEGRKEYGILAEKKAAMWVYNNIVSRRRDPGLLHYTQGNEVTFKVFPFTPGQTRRTGIEFMHKEPVTLNIGAQKITLGDSTLQTTLAQAVSIRSGSYIPAQVKQQAPLKTLKPYLHFVVDGSIHSAKNKAKYIQQIKQYLKQHPDYQKSAKITFSNFAHTTYALSQTPQWAQKLESIQNQGGFYLEDAIKRIVVQAKNTQTSYPEIIVVSNALPKAVFLKTLAGFEQNLKGTHSFYALQKNGSLNRHSLLNTPLKVAQEKVTIPPTRKFRLVKLENKEVLLEDNQQADFLSFGVGLKSFPTKNNLVDYKWERAAELWNFWKAYQLNPNHHDQEFSHRLKIIKGSFRTGIMTPLTSYISLENEAQKAALLAKQKQTLSGNPLLDAGEELTRMSEPSLWFLLGLIGLLFLIKHYWKRIKTTRWSF
ncbi:MSEP-CTERM sorting domain-containing protein [marine bacterium AO1-C]|nr:MSEP-CTERM sorting domain-containing protein [marine bacterium AO1-C]